MFCEKSDPARSWPACVEIERLPLEEHCKACLILRLEAAEHDADVREAAYRSLIAHVEAQIRAARKEAASCA